MLLISQINHVSLSLSLSLAREGIFLDAKLEKIAEVPGASAPGPHHFAGILDRALKADRYLQSLEKASPQTPNLKKSLSFQGLLSLDPITSL